MTVGERPTQFQALGRLLAIVVGVAGLGFWALLAFGWDLGSLSKYLAASTRPIMTPAPIPTRKPASVTLGLPTYQPAKHTMLVPTSAPLAQVPLMIRTEKDGRSYVDVPATLTDQQAFHAPNGEFTDGSLAPVEGGCRITFRLRSGTVARAYVVKEGVVVAVVR